MLKVQTAKLIITVDDNGKMSLEGTANDKREFINLFNSGHGMFGHILSYSNPVYNEDVIFFLNKNKIEYAIKQYDNPVTPSVPKGAVS